MLTPADAILPVNILRNATSLKFATPLRVTTWSAVSAGMKSWSLTSDVPPGAKARNSTSSWRNVVGFSTTVTPLESFHSVMPYASFDVVATIVPGFGAEARSGAVVTVSSYGVSDLAAADAMTAASFASVGRGTPAFVGALTTTTRLRFGDHMPASAFISLRETCGMNRLYSSYSYARPGIGSVVVKLRMYSAAKLADC